MINLDNKHKSNYKLWIIFMQFTYAFKHHNIPQSTVIIKWKSLGTTSTAGHVKWWRGVSVSSERSQTFCSHLLQSSKLHVNSRLAQVQNAESFVEGVSMAQHAANFKIKGKDFDRFFVCFWRWNLKFSFWCYFSLTIKNFSISLMGANLEKQAPVS